MCVNINVHEHKVNSNPKTLGSQVLVQMNLGMLESACLQIKRLPKAENWEYLCPITIYTISWWLKVKLHHCQVFVFGVYKRAVHLIWYMNSKSLFPLPHYIRSCEVLIMKMKQPLADNIHVLYRLLFLHANLAQLLNMICILLASILSVSDVMNETWFESIANRKCQ